MNVLHTLTRDASPAIATEAHARWAALMARDTRSDGQSQEAERAGFRPCKRCRPDRTPIPGAAIRFTIVKSSLGCVLVARSAKGVCAILLGDKRSLLERDLRQRFPQVRLLGSDADTESLAAQVARVVEDPRLSLDLPLDVRGTAFQQRVWGALREIAVGSTVSYAEVARRLGAPRSVRAVAQACAANPFAVLIPCHRVVRHDGALSGYRWGIERKRALLTLESSR